MKLIWTKSNNPLSLFIRWGLKEPCSHVVIVFDNKIVFHSNLKGAHIEWFQTFKKHVTIVHQIEYKLPLEEEEIVYQNIVNAYDQKAYDYKAFGFFIWRALLFRIMNKPFPSKNSWGSPNGYLCTGLAGQLPIEIIPGLEKAQDKDMLSPQKLYEILSASSS